MAFKVGQEVSWVVIQGEWRPGYHGMHDKWFEHYGHECRDGRVMSVGDGLVVIWHEGDSAPSWVAEADVFGAQDYNAIQAKIRERNIAAFGHPDGKWAAERAKKQEAK